MAKVAIKYILGSYSLSCHDNKLSITENNGNLTMSGGVQGSGLF